MSSILLRLSENQKMNHRLNNSLESLGFLYFSLQTYALKGKNELFQSLMQAT